MNNKAPAAVLIGWQAFAVDTGTASARRAAEYLVGFREAGLLVLHIQLLTMATSTSRPWRAAQARDASLQFPALDSAEAEFVAECQPLATEPVVESYRPSAFLDTRLPQLLRSNGARQVVLLGPALQTSILASALTATCLDFEVVVAIATQGDETATASEEAALMVLKNWATVVSTLDVDAMRREHHT